jgi:DNA-binding transcriptional LysR family regulator
MPIEPHGSLSIRIPETVSACYLPEILIKFHHLYPRVNLGFMNCVYFDLPEELSAGVVDLGFLITDVFQTSNLDTEIVCPVPLVFVTGSSHPLSHNIPLDFSRLKEEPLIVPSNDCSYVRMLDRILTEQKIKLPYVWRFNSIAAIKQMLINQVGFSVLPQIAIQSEITSGSLTVLPWQENNPISANLLMIWQKNKWLPPILQYFMQMVRELQVNN